MEQLKPDLVQRGKFENRESKKGIDHILRFDYMGSSEYEWGAMPDSLKEIRSNIADYTYLDVPIKDKVITVFCNSSVKDQMKPYLEGLASGEFHTLEYTAFDSYINGEGFFKDSVDHWWDLGNHLMFWKKNNDFEKAFKEKIEPK